MYFGNETNYGSACAINQPIGLVQSVNPTEKNNLIKVRTLGGTRDYSKIVPGKFEISGSFDYFLQEGPFLRFGWSEDTGTTTGTIDGGPRVHSGASYLHVMGSAASPLAESFPSFTLEFTDAEDSGASATTRNLKRKYTGCRVNNMTMSASVDEPVKVAVDWIAQGVNVSTAAATSVTDSTKDPFVFYQGMVYATSGAVTAYTVVPKTSAIAEVNSFDVGVNNNLESVWYVTGTTNAYNTLRGLKGLLAKGRDYSGKLNLHFKDKAMYQRFLGSNTTTSGGGTTLTNYQVVLDFSRTGFPGSTPKGITDDWQRIVLANCKFGDINIAGKPEDIVSQAITLEITSAKLYRVDTDINYKV